MHPASGRPLAAADGAQAPLMEGGGREAVRGGERYWRKHALVAEERALWQAREVEELERFCSGLKRMGLKQLKRLGMTATEKE